MNKVGTLPISTTVKSGKQWKCPGLGCESKNGTKKSLNFDFLIYITLVPVKPKCGTFLSTKISHEMH